MSALREYVFSVAAAAMICGIVCGIGKDSAAKGILRLVCGLFLTLTVLRPITKLSLEDISHFSLPYSLDAAQASSIGADYSREALADIIKAEIEAYILDKATDLGANLTAEVTLSSDDPPVPIHVRIRGSASPYVKQQLTQQIAAELNIPKEEQQWIG